MTEKDENNELDEDVKEFLQGFQNVVPFTKKHRQELRQFFSLEYLREKSVWWWGEQLLTAALLIYLVSLSGALVDYKMEIQETINSEGCRELLRDPPHLVNRSETWVPIPNVSVSGEKDIRRNRLINGSIYNVSQPDG